MNPYENLPSAASFTLTSSDLREGEKLAMPQVSGIFGAGGEDVSRSYPGAASPQGRRASWSPCATPKRPRSPVSGTGPWSEHSANVTELPAGAGDELGLGLRQRFTPE